MSTGGTAVQEGGPHGRRSQLDHGPAGHEALNRGKEPKPAAHPSSSELAFRPRPIALKIKAQADAGPHLVKRDIFQGVPSLPQRNGRTLALHVD
jgi:hypothetical protein